MSETETYYSLKRTKYIKRQELLWQVIDKRSGRVVTDVWQTFRSYETRGWEPVREMIFKKLKYMEGVGWFAPGFEIGETIDE